MVTGGGPLLIAVPTGKGTVVCQRAACQRTYDPRLEERPGSTAVNGFNPRVAHVLAGLAGIAPMLAGATVCKRCRKEGNTIIAQTRGGR
jgi:hypothetical protein